MPWGSLGSLIERVRTGSVLAPLLALTLICGVAAFSVTLRLGDTSLAWLLWALFAILVAATLTIYVMFALKDPDRLQTEDYRLARHRLELIGDERDPNDARLIEAAPTTNTHLETAS
jgi:membrane protein implicated in regulation of membrane protease activity